MAENGFTLVDSATTELWDELSAEVSLEQIMHWQSANPRPLQPKPEGLWDSYKNDASS